MGVPAKNPCHVDIIDIRREHLDDSLASMTLGALMPTDGQPRFMPTLLLYDEAGLKLFEEITYLDEYYLTNAEIEVLNTHASTIAERIPEGSQMVELGSGNLRKVDILLQAFEKAKKHVTYYALDLSLSELERTFSEISPNSHKYVKCAALHGTYDDGLAWLSKPENRKVPTCVMSMGSSIGNFPPADAAQFLKSFANVMSHQDIMMIGVDACVEPDRVYSAYNDSKGVTERFYRNGLDHANSLLGRSIFKQEDWAIEGLYDEKLHRHEAHYFALNDVSSGNLSFKKGERLWLEYAYKHTLSESDKLWREAGLIRNISFGNAKDDYHLHILTPYRVAYPGDPVEYASQPVPTMNDWEELWNAWDTVTRAMIPNEDLLGKPIQLRNNLIFYLGHIPTFADIHFTKASGQPLTEPAYYPQIFERGIDPDVDDPTQCHAHSEIPDSWPPLNEILIFQNRVRSRVRDQIKSGRAFSDRKLGRSMWLAFEHEVMHLETFLYMLLQSDRILPPPDGNAPDFAALANKARSEATPNKWFSIPASTVTIGLDDPENDDEPDRYFGWDNERPARKVYVPAFEAQARPITNGEYGLFLEKHDQKSVPVAWTTISETEFLPAAKSTNFTNGHNEELNGTPGLQLSDSFLRGKAVRTVYGPVALRYALDWPVMASYNELAEYATWANGRIPTMEEARSIYRYAETLKKDAAHEVPSSLVPAVNGHLSLNGVEETPPSHPRQPKLSSTGESQMTTHTPSPSPSSLFIPLNLHPVSFKHWHPVPVTPHGLSLCGQSDFGGVWEWTSSPLTVYPGFKPMDLYPGYTADFFDGKHNIMLGGSWATHPRIAGRKSFVNWYQRNYPFVWAGARLVRGGGVGN